MRRGECVSRDKLWYAEEFKTQLLMEIGCVRTFNPVVPPGKWFNESLLCLENVRA